MGTSPIAAALVLATLGGAPSADAALEQAVRDRASLGAEAEVRIGTIHAADEALWAQATRVTAVTLPGGEDGIGNVTARADLEVPGDPGAWTWLRAQVDVLVPTVVAKRTLERGATVGPSDVELVLRPPRRGQLGPQDAVMGLATTRRVESGAALQRTWVKARDVMTRGVRVDAVVRSGAVTVRAAAEAMGRGAIADTVRVRLLATGRVLRGTIVGPGTVEVSL